MNGFITPIERHTIGWNLTHEVRISYNNIRPKLHGAVVFSANLVDLLEIIEVDSSPALGFYNFFASPVAQVDGFIASDVYLSTFKVRDHLSNDIFSENNRLWIGSAEPLLDFSIA